MIMGCQAVSSQIMFGVVKQVKNNSRLFEL